MKNWKINSWKNYPVKHIPEYPDKKELDIVLGKINADVSKKGNFQLLLIGCALLLYGLVGHIIFFVFNLEGILSNLITGKDAE